MEQAKSGEASHTRDPQITGFIPKWLQGDWANEEEPWLLAGAVPDTPPPEPTAEVAVELLRTCLELLEGARPFAEYCEEDCQRTWGENAPEMHPYQVWLEFQLNAVAELKAILGEK